MKKYKKKEIVRENGDCVEAQLPIIVSASRSTDIPAFYSDWFFHRLGVGYSAWDNPFNGVRYYVSYEDCRFIVFWSKNPEPLIAHLDELRERGIGCYVQYTLNDYEREGLERGVPALDKRVDTFKRLVDKLGFGSVVWRFDPLILVENRIGVPELLEKVERVGDMLKGYTERLVFSYADIGVYKRVAGNLLSNGVRYIEWDEDSEMQFAYSLSDLNKKWGYELMTCGEKVSLEQCGIRHGKCIDDGLIRRISPDDEVLKLFLDGCSKDGGQRKFCGCIMSKDIGEYNTCPHLCEYCYANSSKEVAVGNWRRHESEPFGETITGK